MNSLFGFWGANLQGVYWVVSPRQDEKALGALILNIKVFAERPFCSFLHPLQKYCV